MTRADSLPLPVLLVHAVTRDARDLEPFVPLSEGMARPRPVDLLGHGAAPRAARYRIADFAAALPLPQQPVAIYGHSLGAMVALRAAAAAPGRVRALVLEDPPFFDSRPPRLDTTPWADGFRKLKSLMTGRCAGHTVADWEHAVARWPSGHGARTIADAGGPAAIRRRARQIAALDPAVLDFMVDPVLHEGFDVVTALRTAGCPVTVLAGARDEGSALAEEDLRLLAGEPNVTVVRLSGAGHYLREAQPERCAEALRATLTASA